MSEDSPKRTSRAKKPPKSVEVTEAKVEEAPEPPAGAEAKGDRGGSLESTARRVFGQVRDTARALAQDAAELVRSRPWQPAVDVLLQGDEIIVRADIPGVEPGTVEVSATPNAVTIKGHREPDPKPEEVAEGQVVIYEVQRKAGAFAREIPLPHPVESEKIAARVSRGVLEVRIPVAGEKTVRPT